MGHDRMVRVHRIRKMYAVHKAQIFVPGSSARRG